MIGADEPDDGGLGYLKREGPTPKLVVVGIVWAGFGVFGLFTALLMHSSGFAVFGVLCLVAGVGLYFGQRTRDQLAYDELHLSTDPWSPPSDEPVDVGDEGPAADEDSSTVGHSRHDHDDDILDAEYTEYTEYFEYEQSPADQDDGTGYDDDEVAYQRYQADHQARDDDDEDEDHGAAGEPDEDDEDDDVARTSRIPTRDADDDASSGHGSTGHDDEHGSDHEDREDREGSAGRRR